MRKNLIIFLLFFIGLCFLTPVYFIADDWEHLNWYHQDLPPHTLIQLFYRHTGLYIVHQIFFPLFAEGHFILGKFVIYSFLIGSMLLICDLFIKNFWTEFKNNLWMLFLPLFMAFAPNQYEWNYWPTNMTCIPSLFLMTLFFWAEKTYKHYILSFIKNFFYIFAGFTFESLIPLAVLLEISYVFYLEKRTFLDGIKRIISRTLPMLIIFFLAKYKLNSMAPFSYDAKFGFKLHLFQQWLSLFFSHDYYKTRHLTGSLAALSMIVLTIYRWKNLEKDLRNKEIFILFSLTVGCCYYWMIQDYSSRRAVGGQLYFFWGWFSIYLFSLFKDLKSHPLSIKVTAFLFLFSTFAHHGYVFKTKYHEKVTIEVNAQKARDLVDDYQGNAYRFDPSFPRQNLGRAWNFIGVRQLNGFLRHYLNDEQLGKVNLQDGSHRRVVPDPPF